MHRRTFFTAAVTGAVSAAAGCLSGGEAIDDYKADISYQQCTESFVPLREIPRKGRDEVETALEDGEYAADKLAYPALVSDHTTLWDTDDNRYYTHRVNTDDSTPKLIFEETTPARENSGTLIVSNQTTETVEIETTISTDSEPLVDSELSADPADDINQVESISSYEYAGEEGAARQLPSIEFPNEYRDYEVEVVVETVDDEFTETATVGVHPWFEYYWVQISDDGILTGSLWENNDAFFSEDEGHTKEGVHWKCTQPPSGWP